jgi:hypothetical protein
LEINGSIELGWDSRRTEVAHSSLMMAAFLSFCAQQFIVHQFERYSIATAASSQTE